MNCANHPQTDATAYCRTCGKPVCESCKRDVHGVIYCEDCLAARVGQQAATGSGVQPAPAFVPPQPNYNPGGPNPAIAGILSGFLSFGTGVMYAGEFVRALLHAGVFIALIALEVHEANVSAPSPTFLTLGGLAIGFWYFFMIFDAVRVAKAKQRGEPVPDLFGFGLVSEAEPAAAPGVPAAAMEPSQPQSRVPMGAIILIGLGVLFLFGNVWDWDWIGRLWPLILIAIGMRLFFRRPSRGGVRCGCMRCTAQCSMGAAVLITLGVLFLLENLTYRFDFGRTWPLLLIVIGVVAFLRSSGSTEGHIESGPPAPPAQPIAQSEVHNG